MKILMIGGTGLISWACSELAIERGHELFLLNRGKSANYNTKIKRFVPDFVATTPWTVGVRKALVWHAADPSRQTIDAAANRLWDTILPAYERAYPQ